MEDLLLGNVTKIQTTELNRVNNCSRKTQISEVLRFFPVFRQCMCLFMLSFTAISRNVVGKKQKTAQANPERYFGIRSMNFNKSIDASSVQ